MPVTIFLGGTCGNNKWRDVFLRKMEDADLPYRKYGAGYEFFNPVVAEWNEEAQRKEDEAKRTSDFILFYIGDPGDGTMSFYSLCEAIMALYDDPDRTCVCFDSSGLSPHAKKAMEKVQKDLKRRFPNEDIYGSMDELIKGMCD